MSQGARLLAGVGLLTLCGCAASVPLHSGKTTRLQVGFALRDMTGSGADSSLGRAITSVLQEECLYVAGPASPSTWRSESWEVRMGANPFRDAPQGAETTILLDGIVERRDYGPATSQRLDALEGFVVLGPIGYAMASLRSDANSYVSAFQCRATGNFGAPILVRQARVADVRSNTRTQVDTLVMMDAARRLLFDLAERMAKQGRLTFQTRRGLDNTESEMLDRIEKWRLECGSNGAANAPGTGADR